MLAHQFTAYGIIQEHDLVLNEARLMESWDGSSPFETVLINVDQCIAYTAYAGNLYSPGQILAKVFHVVFQTSLFLHAGSGNGCQQLRRPMPTSSTT
jgi:hypothetical protein